MATKRASTTGHFTTKDAEQWKWRIAFLKAVVNLKTKGSDKRVRDILIETLFPLWRKAEDEHEALAAGRNYFFPVADYQKLKYGGTVPCLDIPGVPIPTMDYFQAQESWPALSTASEKTAELLKEWNLDGYTGKDGKKNMVVWVRWVMLDTIDHWTDKGFNEFSCSDFQRKGRPLYIPRDVKVYIDQVESRAVFKPGSLEDEIHWEEEAPGVTSFGVKRRTCPIAFNIPVWDPIADRDEKKWIRETIKAHFSPEAIRGALQAYIGETKLVAADDSDLVLTRGGRLNLERSIPWLAEYQVGGLTQTAIADREGIARQAVDSALKSASKAIGLPMKKAQGGDRRSKL